MTRLQTATISTVLIVFWLGVWAIHGPLNAAWAGVTALTLGCVGWTWRWAMLPAPTQGV